MKQEYIDEFKNLEKIDVSKNKKDATQLRGRKFETLINDILKDEKILLKGSYYTNTTKNNYVLRDEQIDAAIEVYSRVLLVEVKWKESNIAASELYSFIGKVENKFQGTIGLFISREPLHENFINALDKGRRQSIIILHGLDMDGVFTGNFSFKKFIEFAIKKLSYENQSYFSVKNYLKEVTKLGSTGNASPTKTFLKEIFEKKYNFSNLSIKISSLDTKNKNKIFEILLEKFEDINLYVWKENEFHLLENTINYFTLYIPDKSFIINQSNKYYTDYIINRDLYLYGRNEFIQMFSEYFKEITDISDFENKFPELWDKYYQNFEMENILTNIIEPIWKNISKTLKQKLLPYYIEIFVDSYRKEKFEQRIFANKLFSDHTHEEFTKRYLKNKIIETSGWFGVKSNSDEEYVVKSIINTYHKLFIPLGYETFEDFKKFIIDTISEIK